MNFRHYNDERDKGKSGPERAEDLWPTAATMGAHCRQNFARNEREVRIHEKKHKRDEGKNEGKSEVDARFNDQRTYTQGSHGGKMQKKISHVRTNQVREKGILQR